MDIDCPFLHHLEATTALFPLPPLHHCFCSLFAVGQCFVKLVALLLILSREDIMAATVGNAVRATPINNDCGYTSSDRKGTKRSKQRPGMVVIFNRLDGNRACVHTRFLESGERESGREGLARALR